LKIIPEIARLLINRGFKLNQDITEYGIVNYLTEYLFHERTIESNIIISDRSLIDLLAYVKTNNSIKIRKKYVELIEEIVFEESKRFNTYLYIPIEFQLVLDNVRSTDIEYQKQVDNTFIQLFKYYNITPNTITGNVAERTRKVLDFINGKY
ncbi:MAG: AAA family ATPase, partial [Bacteroidales bacterium]|nr:AAA family ATPase [Bacteroidales bacterium]